MNDRTNEGYFHISHSTVRWTGENSFDKHNIFPVREYNNSRMEIFFITKYRQTQTVLLNAVSVFRPFKWLACFHALFFVDQISI